MIYSSVILAEILRLVNPTEAVWIASKSKGNAKELALAFVMTPRFVSKTSINNSTNVIDGWDWQDYTLEKLVRIYFICLISEKDGVDQLNLLFDTAEINEAVALHSALPALKNPTHYLLRATDAVRSNMGSVFESIAFENPYPSLYFSELAWNQMVLNVYLTTKPSTEFTAWKPEQTKHLLIHCRTLPMKDGRPEDAFHLKCGDWSLYL